MSPRTIRLLVMASVLAVFLAGLVIGYAINTQREDRRANGSPSTASVPPRPPRGPAGPDTPINRRLERLTIRLDLSEAQRATLRKILSDGDSGARAIIDRVRPELEAKRAEI